MPAPSDQLDAGHRGVVALARPELEDAGVAAVALEIARGDVVHELVGHLAVAEETLDLADLVGPARISGVPEYIAQLLDKLIANAVEFSHPGKPIVVYCRAIKDQAVLRVSNYGPLLPEEMKGRLFDSMISVRPQEKQREPHLGMGLHIARLVTEFHQGQIRADNLPGGDGVAITLSIPLLQD